MIPMEHARTRMEAASGTAASDPLASRHFLGCILLCFVPIVLAWDLMRLVATLVFDNNTYTHIPLIPVISLFLIYSDRRSIFSKHRDDRWINRPS